MVLGSQQQLVDYLVRLWRQWQSLSFWARLVSSLRVRELIGYDIRCYAFIYAMINVPFFPCFICWKIFCNHFCLQFEFCNNIVISYSHFSHHCWYLSYFFKYWSIVFMKGGSPGTKTLQLLCIQLATPLLLLGVNIKECRKRCCNILCARSISTRNFITQRK